MSHDKYAVNGGIAAHITDMDYGCSYGLDVGVESLHVVRVTENVSIAFEIFRVSLKFVELPLS